MARHSLLSEFFAFIREEKKWWLLPLILALSGLGAFLVFSSTSPLAPFIYPFF